MSWWRRLRPVPAPAVGEPDPFASLVTTELDVRMCFRLLLGRAPNPEEWSGHSAHAGHPLAPVVAGYLNSLEFARRGLMVAPEEGRPVVAEHPGFRMYASPSDLQVGVEVLKGVYEPDVTAVFRSVLRPGMCVVDVGANIGFFSMLSASVVGAEGAVLAVEPNGENVRLLEASRRLNGFETVVVAQVAAGPALGLLALHSTYSNGTTSDPAAELDGLLAGRTVPSLPVDALVAAAWPGGRRVGLIKVDVEGAEYKALSGARGVIARDRPLIISEFSPTMMPGISGIEGPEYLRWLHALGYRVAVIQSEGPPLDTGTAVEPVMRAFERSGVDHIDLLATPV